MGWNPSDWLADEFLASERKNKVRLLIDVCERVESFTNIEPGEKYFSTNKSGNSLSPIIRTATRELEALTFDDQSPVILIDRRGAAIINLHLDDSKYFDPNLSAFRASSSLETLWIWAYMNSGLGRQASTYLSALAQKSPLPNSSTSNLLVREMPTMDTKQAEDLFSLAIQVNSELTEEEMEQTHYSIRQLKEGSKWQLKLLRETVNSSQGQLLGTQSTFIKRGNPALEVSDVGLPVATGRWIRNGEIREFCTPLSAGNEIAMPGDILTLGIGDVSLSRIATEPMAVRGTLFHIKLTPETDPSFVNSFLNSPEATKQRRELLDSGMFLKSISASNLAKLRVVETVDLRDACRDLVNGLISK